MNCKMGYALGLLTLGLLSCNEGGVAGDLNEDSSSSIQTPRSSGSNTSSSGTSNPLPEVNGDLIINHHHTDLSEIPVSWIEEAKDQLVIAYGHTSHGSQLTAGLVGLYDWKGSPYEVNVYTDNGGLQIQDAPFQTANDLGAPDFTAWVGATRSYLDAHAEVNVVMWSWCGQVSWASEENIHGYLDSMSALEEVYPDVKFVLMTGHLDGTGKTGALTRNNEIIRAFAKANDKILYDFADIESYDPDGNEFMSRNANDNCDYDGGNWCSDWQASHPGEWYQMDAAHSQPLNGNLKAYAAWHLFARLAGWDGN